MRRSTIQLSFLLYSLFVTNSAQGSWFSPLKARSVPVSAPADKQLALVDPLEEKRQKAFETLKRYPQLINHIQQNKDTLGFKDPSPSSATTLTAPQKTAMGVQGLIDFLKQEQERAPQRPLIVTVNVNNQSLYSDKTEIQKITPPPTNAPPDTRNSFVTEGIEWARAHKKLCFWYCLLGLYGAVHLYLLSLRRYLNKEGTWSRWKHHLTLEDLYQITTPTLIKDILRTKRHTEDQESCLTPIALLKECLQEMKNELSSFTTYKNFIVCIQQLPLHRLLLWKPSSYEEVSSRIQRLLYLKNALIAFLEEHQKASQEEGHRTSVPKTSPAL